MSDGIKQGTPGAIFLTKEDAKVWGSYEIKVGDKMIPYKSSFSIVWDEDDKYHLIVSNRKDQMAYSLQDMYKSWEAMTSLMTQTMGEFYKDRTANENAKFINSTQGIVHNSFYDNFPHFREMHAESKAFRAEIKARVDRGDAYLECDECSEIAAWGDKDGLFYDGQELICGCSGNISFESEEEDACAWVNNTYEEREGRPA